LSFNIDARETPEKRDRRGDLKREHGGTLPWSRRNAAYPRKLTLAKGKIHAVIKGKDVPQERTPGKSQGSTGRKVKAPLGENDPVR